MKEPNRKVVIMQWIVIAVLVVGGAVGAYLMVHKLSDLQDTNTTLNGENDDLHNQLNQAQQATPSPTPSPSPSASATPSPTPTPAVPAATHTPTPAPKR